MLAKGLSLKLNEVSLRRFLPYVIAGLLAAAILVGWNVAFAQDITSDAAKLDQGTNLIWMVGAFLVFFMQAGFRLSRSGLNPVQKYGQLYDQELYGLCHRFPVLLGFWLCSHVGNLGGGHRRNH